MRNWKQSKDNSIYEECQVIIVPDNYTSIDVRVATFKPREFNRAKEKRKTQELIDEYYKGEQR